MSSAQGDGDGDSFFEDNDDSEFNSEYDEDDEPSDPTPNPNPSPKPNPNPNPSPSPNINGSDHPAPLTSYAPSSGRKRRRRSSSSATAAAAASEESRRMFQKLWTDDDELTILQGFLDFTSQRGTTHADYQYDTGPFFDQISPRLQLAFNKNQVIEKLRRLKRKYRNAVGRISAGKDESSVFKNPHDRATFEISRKIWNSSFSKARKPRSDRPPPNGSSLNGGNLRPSPNQGFAELAAVEVTVRDSAVPPSTAAMPQSMTAPSLTSLEETVRVCLSPLFKELVRGVVGGGGMNLNPLQLDLQLSRGPEMDERWKQQQILELEVLLKRAELMQEQIKSTLEELRSKDS